MNPRQNRGRVPLWVCQRGYILLFLWRRLLEYLVFHVLQITLVFWDFFFLPSFNDKICWSDSILPACDDYFSFKVGQCALLARTELIHRFLHWSMEYKWKQLETDWIRSPMRTGGSALGYPVCWEENHLTLPVSPRLPIPILIPAVPRISRPVRWNKLQ